MHDGLLCSYVVARYRPAGNFIGEFVNNVLRGKFNGAQCSYTTKKSTIANVHSGRRTSVSTSIKRSRIPHPKHMKSSRKTLMGYGDFHEESSHEPTMDDAIVNKANSVWLPDLETGIYGSDLAGMIPLRVEAGHETNLQKYANQTMEEESENDQTVTSKYASKLREQLQRFLSPSTDAGKGKTDYHALSKADLNAASVGFQNMDDSFKKSKPTFTPVNSETKEVESSPLVGQEGEKQKPLNIVSGNAGSSESLLSTELISKVDEAVDRLQSAAQSVTSAASPAAASNLANSAAIVSETVNANAVLANSAGNMGSFANPALNNAMGMGSSGTQSNQDSAALTSPPAAPHQNSVPPASASPLAPNMDAENQQLLSKEAEEKQKAIASYTPTGEIAFRFTFLS